MEGANNDNVHTGARERRYSSPRLLEMVGPMLRATWSIPPKIEAAYQMTRRNPPPPVEGYVLIDTGAVRTSIAQAAVDELGLESATWERAHGTGGDHQATIYLAQLSLALASDEENDTYMSAVVPAMAVPGLSGSLELREDDGEPAQVIGLLGRDFLRNVVLTYDGPSGRFRIEVPAGAVPAKRWPEPH